MTEESLLDRDDVLESLSEARIALSYMARLAIEEGDKALAARLSAQDAALKARIKALHARSEAEWETSAAGLRGKFQGAQSHLEGLLDILKKSETVMDGLTKAAGVMDDLLALLV
jgi:hypothetical protein